MSRHEAARAQLEKQLDSLLQRVGAIEGDLRKAKSPDWPEQAIEIENDEVLKGLDEISRAEVGRIRAALDRIASGSYGTCATCGQAISAERLQAIPSAVVCLTCASAASARRKA